MEYHQNAWTDFLCFSKLPNYLLWFVVLPLYAHGKIILLRLNAPDNVADVELEGAVVPQAFLVLIANNAVLPPGPVLNQTKTKLSPEMWFREMSYNI